MDKFNYITSNSFSNAYGNDEFALGVGSKGARVLQLQQALRVLGEPIDEDGFGTQTRTALVHLDYQPSILNQDKFNEIILRAYSIGKKQMTLTEPQMRALWMKEVSPERRDKVTFEVWLKRQGVKQKIGQGGKAVFDVLFGWLQMRARGAGDTAGGVGSAPDQPVDTGGGWFSRTSDSGIPTAVYVVGGIVGAGLLIWGVSFLAKKSAQKVAYVQQAPVMN